MLLKSDRLPFVTSLGKVVRHSSSLGGGNQGTCAVRGFFHGVWEGRAARWGARGPGSGGLVLFEPRVYSFRSHQNLSSEGRSIWVQLLQLNRRLRTRCKWTPSITLSNSNMRV